MLQDAFRVDSGPTLGVELELQIIDAGTLALRPGIDELLANLPEDLEDSVKPEFHACCVEVSTGVCRGVDEVRDDLRAKLRRLSQIAAGHGIILGWGGTHPFSHWKEQPLTPDGRYRRLADQYQETLLRQATFGMHVHVGVPSGDAAIRACDRLREHLPVLLALSANSPFWCGRATGLMSHRVEVQGSVPGGGVPPRLGDWQGYTRLVKNLTTCGQIESPRDLWWDARPSPAHGTLEIRIFDMPLGLDAALGLTALAQCLVHSLTQPDDDDHPEADPADPDLEPAQSLVLQQNRWLAARHGLDAELIDPFRGLKVPARDQAGALVDRLLPIGQKLGCAAALRDLGLRSRGATGAERQLEAHRGGGLAEVVRLITRPDPPSRWSPALSLAQWPGFSLLGMPRVQEAVGLGP